MITSLTTLQKWHNKFTKKADILKKYDKIFLSKKNERKGMKMKKIFTLFTLVLFLTTIKANANETQKITKLSKHVYAYMVTMPPANTGNSFGSNAGIIIGKNSVLVIDTLLSAKHAEKLLRDIKALTDKPIKHVVNTHFHFDHVLGNCVFAEQGAQIIGHQNTNISDEKIELLMSKPETFGLTKEALEGTTVKTPDILFSDTYKIDLGGVTISLKAWGHSHTGDSITVFIEEDNVLFTGDILFNKYHPFIGESNIPNWTQVLKDIQKIDAKIIVPGHGPVASNQDISDMINYINAFDLQAKKLLKNDKEKTPEELSKEIELLLPKQGRKELHHLIKINLSMKYLNESATEKKSTYKKD